MSDGEAEAMTDSRLRDIERTFQAHHSAEHMNDAPFPICSSAICMDHGDVVSELKRLRRVSPALVPTPENPPTRSAEAADELREQVTSELGDGVGEREGFWGRACARLLARLNATRAERDVLAARLLALPVPVSGTAPKDSGPALVALQRLSEAATSGTILVVDLGYGDYGLRLEEHGSLVAKGIRNRLNAELLAEAWNYARAQLESLRSGDAPAGRASTQEEAR